MAYKVVHDTDSHGLLGIVSGHVDVIKGLPVANGYTDEVKPSLVRLR